MTSHLRYPPDAPFIDLAHHLVLARRIAADPMTFTTTARFDALETLRTWGDGGDAAGITSLRLSLAPVRPAQRPTPGAGVIMVLAVAFVALAGVAVGWLMRGAL
jgi:hypothetical protein